nr:MAG TPA: TREPONEMA DENTICOLA VARIABLE PROTEIN 1 FUNCTION, PERIODONTAL DISEASE [Caudoviricetes sp.]DAT22731.1 MAG TPA: TREPONEMA DENTICOLA VARIABLE PROTEIN 1 FUNCTION, PERIODONTAL DISEASE [Caudoviricetes sp.]
MFQHGGNWNNGSKCGLFTANLNNTSSNSNTNIGSRLLLLKGNIHWSLFRRTHW